MRKVETTELRMVQAGDTNIMSVISSIWTFFNSWDAVSDEKTNTAYYYKNFKALQFDTNGWILQLDFSSIPILKNFITSPVTLINWSSIFSN